MPIGAAAAGIRSRREAAAGGGLTRQNFYAESVAQSTHTGTTAYQDKVALTFTPDASAEYFMLWRAIYGINDASRDLGARFYHTTAAAEVGGVNFEPHDLTDQVNVFGLARYTAPASPAEQTWNIQYATLEATFRTISIEDARVVALKRETGDEYAEVDGSSSTSNSNASKVTKATLSFTPASAGDYLLIATAELNCGTTSVAIGAELHDGSSSWGGPDGLQFNDTASWAPWGTVVRRTALSGSQTFTLRFWSNGVATTSIRRARILAIRLDTLDADFYAESRTRSTHTGTLDFQTKLTLTETLPALDHLVIACGFQDLSNNSAFPSQARLTEDAVVVGRSQVREGDIAAQFCPLFALYRKSFAAASVDIAAEYATGNSGQTVGFQEAAIAVLQLES